MSFWQFCKEWGRRAWSGQFKRAKEVHGAAALASGFALLVIREKWPDMSPLLSVISWLPFLLFAAVFVAALAYGLMTAPYEIYVEQALQTEAAEATIADLARAAEPIVKFVSPGDMGVATLPKLAHARLYRVALQNLSPKVRLETVEVTLRAYANNDGRTVIARTLQDAKGNKESVITPSAIKHFDAILIRPDKTPARVYFGPWGELLSPHTCGPGSYELEIEATSGVTQPVLARYLLKVTDSGHVALEFQQ